MRDLYIDDTPNNRAGDELLDRVRALAPLGLGSFADVHGPAGTGKTSWLLRRAREQGGVVLRACQAWATGSTVEDSKSMLNDLLDALGENQYGRPRAVYQLYAELLAALSRRAPTFIGIDEADYLVLVRRSLARVNLLRDASDETRIPFIFLGVTRFAKRIEQDDEFTGTIKSRVVAQTEFAPPTLRDATLFASKLVEHVEFEADLINWSLATVRHNLRGLIRLFQSIERAAVDAGLAGRLSLKRATELGLEPVVQLLSVQRVQRAREQVQLEVAKAPLTAIGKRA